MPKAVNSSRAFHSPYEEQPLVRPAAVYTRHLIRPLSKKHPGWDVAKRVVMAIFAAPVYVLLGVPALIGLPFVKKNQPPRPLSGASTVEPNPALPAQQPVVIGDSGTSQATPNPIPHQVTTQPVGSPENATESARRVLFSPKLERIPASQVDVVGDRKSVTLEQLVNEADEEELEELSISDESDVGGSDSETSTDSDSVSSSSSSSDEAAPTQPLLSSQNRRLGRENALLNRSNATPLRAAQKVEAPKRGKEKAKKLFERPFQLEVRQRGELITAALKDAKGHTFCHEVAERGRTVQHLHKSIAQKKAKIDELLHSSSITPAKARELAFLREDVANAEARLNQLLQRSPSATWASTDAPRAHFRLIKEDLIKKGYSKSKAKKEALILAKQQALPILGNLRHQEVKFIAPEGLQGYKDPRLPEYLGKKSSQGVIYDSAVLERYNLYLELKAGKSLDHLQKDPSYKEQLKQLSKEAGFKGEGKYTPQAMINFMERISIPYYVSNDRGINRSAAVTDFMHGETNHEDLTAYLVLERLMKDPAIWGTLSETERLSIKTYFPGIMDSHNKFRKSVAKETLHNLKQTFVKAYPEFNLKQLNSEKLTNKISEIARRREEHLFEKAMQDLALHLENHPLEANANFLFYGRIGFVDPRKDISNDKDGFCLNERSQALDSAAIYRLLDGKTLVFDGDDNSVPMRDLNDPNIIHLPKKFRKGNSNPSKSVTLQTSYINLSVAGNLSNKGDQVAINREGLARLEKAIANAGLTEKEFARATELLGNVRIGLQEGKEGGDFAVVDQALELMTMLGYASCNCYGGKDRTGYGVAVHDHSKMKKYLQAVHPDDPNYKDKADIYAALGRELISYKGIIISVIRDNVAISAMKLARGDLDLLLDGDGLEFAKGAGRLFANTFQFVEGFLPEAMQKAGQAIAGVKKGEGDLYS